MTRVAVTQARVYCDLSQTVRERPRLLCHPEISSQNEGIQGVGVFPDEHRTLPGGGDRLPSWAVDHRRIWGPLAPDWSRSEGGE